MSLSFGRNLKNCTFCGGARVDGDAHVETQLHRSWKIPHALDLEGWARMSFDISVDTLNDCGVPFIYVPSGFDRHYPFGTPWIRAWLNDLIDEATYSRNEHIFSWHKSKDFHELLKIWAANNRDPGQEPGEWLSTLGLCVERRGPHGQMITYGEDRARDRY